MGDVQTQVLAFEKTWQVDGLNNKVVICIPTHGSVSALLFGQWIGLSAWCTKKNIPIVTIENRTHNDARNWLATAGGGFQKPNQLINQVDYIIWIDSDQVFSVEDLEKLIDCDEKFCTGWYLKGDTPMVARWDEKTFLKTGSMDFLTKEELEQSKGKLIEVSYCGFGFTKTHVDLFKELTYPFLPIKQFKQETTEKMFQKMQASVQMLVLNRK